MKVKVETRDRLERFKRKHHLRSFDQAINVMLNWLNEELQEDKDLSGALHSQNGKQTKFK